MAASFITSPLSMATEATITFIFKEEIGSVFRRIVSTDEGEFPMNHDFSLVLKLEVTAVFCLHSHHAMIAPLFHICSLLGAILVSSLHIYTLFSMLTTQL